jgi:hypothetical protein
MPHDKAGEKLLEFCDSQFIGCATNQNYKAMSGAYENSLQLMDRIMNFVTVVRPTHEIPYLIDQLTNFFDEC